MKEPIFKIRDKVTSPLDPTFLAQVTSIVHQEDGYLYTATYYKEGEPRTSNFYGFELELASADIGFGFSREMDTVSSNGSGFLKKPC